MTNQSATETIAGNRWPRARRPLGVGIMVPIAEEGHYGDATPRFADIVELGQAAREHGFDALWFADHFSYKSDDGSLRGSWEAFTLMAGVAAAVPDLQIGVLVACTGFRNPGLVAKMASAIDEISDGRFILGLGAGWNKPEYDQFGYPFDYRVSRFEDAINIIHPLLRQGTADYQGRFFQANNAVNAPLGPRPDGPPILIGSSGDRMLHSVARFADAWNTGWHPGTERVIPLVEKVDAAMRAAGRDPGTLAKTVGTNFQMDPTRHRRPNAFVGSNEERARLLREFRDLGMVHVIAGLDLCTTATIADFGGALRILDTM